MEQKTEVTATVTAGDGGTKADPQLASAAIEASSVSPDDDNPPVSASDDPIKIAETEDERKVREFMEKVVQARQAKEKAEQPVPPPPMTERQRAAIEEEQAAGRRALARHAEQQKLRPPPVREKSDGTSNPVFRPGDYVPNMAHGNTGARDVPRG